MIVAMKPSNAKQSPAPVLHHMDTEPEASDSDDSTVTPHLYTAPDPDFTTIKISRPPARPPFCCLSIETMVFPPPLKTPSPSAHLLAFHTAAQAGHVLRSPTTLPPSRSSLANAVKATDYAIMLRTRVRLSYNFTFVVPAELEGHYVELVKEEEKLYRGLFREWPVQGEGMRLRCCLHNGDWTAAVVLKKDGTREDRRKVEFPGSSKVWYRGDGDVAGYV